MLLDFKNGQTSIVLRVKLRNSSVSTGAGLTGLTSASSGLVISTIADNEASATAYTVAGSTIEGITTPGTFATPTATKCRFKELDSTNHKGVYEIQIDNARFAVSNAKSLLVSISGATNLAECDVIVPLRSVDPYDGVRGGMTALPNAAAEAAGGLYTRGTGAGQIKQTNNGEIDSNTTHVNNVSTSSVTTINPNLGTTQPVNFHGTGATAYVKSDLIEIADTAWASTTLFTLASHDPGATLGTSTLTQSQVTGGAYPISDASFAFSSSLPAVNANTAAIAGTTLTGTADIGANFAALYGSSAAGPANQIRNAVWNVPNNTTRTLTAATNITSDGSTISQTQLAHLDADISSRSTLTQTQVTGGAYSVQSASCVLGDARIAHLDADVSSRMATFTLPTNFAALGISVGGHISNVDTLTTYTGNTPQTGDAYARLGAPAGASVSADIAAVKTDTSTLTSRITSTIFAGITSFKQWLGLLAGKQVGDSTARTELRSTGAGSGTFDETAHSLEAIRTRGDLSWTTATGFVLAASAPSWYTTPPTAVANADALLGRNVAGGSTGGRTVSEAMYAMRNKVDVANGHVYATDDTTVAWSFVVTTDPAASPVTVIDPS